MLFPCPVLLGVVLNHVPHRPPHCSRNLSLIPIFCRTFFASPEFIPFTFISSTAKLRRVFVHLASGRFRHLHFLLSHVCLAPGQSHHLLPSSGLLLLRTHVRLVIFFRVRFSLGLLFCTPVRPIIFPHPIFFRSYSSHPCQSYYLLTHPIFSRSFSSHHCQTHQHLPFSFSHLSVFFFALCQSHHHLSSANLLSVLFFAPRSVPSSSLPIESSLGLLLSTHVSPIIVFLPHPVLVESLFILPHVVSIIFFPPHPVFSWSSSSHPSQYYHLIRGSRVRIPAGSAGKCSSPGSTFSADFYFGIRSTPCYRSST